jgi:hypothetical protein
MPAVSQDEFHEVEVESRWEAAPAVVAVIALQLLLALISQHNGWELWGLPWWVWLAPLVPELILLLPLAWRRGRHQLAQLGHRRTVALMLVGVVSLANGFALITLIGSLASGQERSGGELLLKAATIWVTNVIAFGLWFWVLDRGGPTRRRLPDPPKPDFQFPQLENPGLAERGWHPRLLDYVYLSFTNSTAFSPTDAMPLSHRAKLLMLIESGASATTILLVAARAVSILV